MCLIDGRHDSHVNMFTIWSVQYKGCNCLSLTGAIKGVTKVLVCFGDACNKDLNVYSLYLTYICLYRLLL